MTSQSNLTVLLTLKDRPEFTLRWINFAEHTRFPVHVLIADGSSDDVAERIFSDRGRFPHVDYEYRRYPVDASYSRYYEKIEDALGRVRTPYVAMADNDDFLVASALEQSARFLDENPAYVACGGQGALFWIRAAAGRVDDRLYGSSIDWKCTSLVRSNEAPSAMERLRGLSISTADPLYYDVKRIGEARRQFALVRQLNLSDLFLVEFLVHYLTVISGPTRRFDELYLARQHNSPGSSGIEHQHRFGDWLGRMMIGTWSSDFGKFVDAMAQALAAADDVAQTEARELVLEIYRQHVAPMLLSDLLEQPTVTLPMLAVLPTVRRLVGMSEKNLLKRAFRRIYRRMRWISLDAVIGTEILTRPIPGIERDFLRINEFLARKP